MKENLTRAQVWLRWLLGSALTTILFMGGPLWTATGFYLLFTAALRFCFIKKIVRP